MAALLLWPQDFTEPGTIRTLHSKDHIVRIQKMMPIPAYLCTNDATLLSITKLRAIIAERCQEAFALFQTLLTQEL